MSLPLATTTITVRRSNQDGTKDLRDGVTYSTLASGIRAVIGSPSGSETIAAGSQEAVDWRLDADPTDLRHDDLVIDDTTGITYLVLWTANRSGFGLDHTVAGLRHVNDRVAS